MDRAIPVSHKRERQALFADLAIRRSRPSNSPLILNRLAQRLDHGGNNMALDQLLADAALVLVAFDGRARHVRFALRKPPPPPRTADAPAGRSSSATETSCRTLLTQSSHRRRERGHTIAAYAARSGTTSTRRDRKRDSIGHYMD